MRLCSACKIEKPLSSFYRRRQSADGFNRRCKDCLDTYNKPYQATYRVNKQESHLKLTYGLTVQDIPNKCQLCGLEETSRKTKRKICVDHDHKTGKLRGFLCNNCNLGIGYAKDNPALLRKWADYLEGKL